MPVGPASAATHTGKSLPAGVTPCTARATAAKVVRSKKQTSVGRFGAAPSHLVAPGVAQLARVCMMRVGERCLLSIVVLRPMRLGVRNARNLARAVALYALCAPQLLKTPRLVQLAVACTLLVCGGVNVALAFASVFLYTGRYVVAR